MWHIDTVSMSVYVKGPQHLNEVNKYALQLAAHAQQQQQHLLLTRSSGTLSNPLFPQI